MSDSQLQVNSINYDLEAVRNLTPYAALKYANERNLTFFSNPPEYWNGIDHAVVRQIIFYANVANKLLAHIPDDVKLDAFKKMDEAEKLNSDSQSANVSVNIQQQEGEAKP